MVTPTNLASYSSYSRLLSNMFVYVLSACNNNSTEQVQDVLKRRTGSPRTGIKIVPPVELFSSLKSPVVLL